MGRVAVLFRLMPDGVEADVPAIASAVKPAMPPGATVRGLQVKEIAYGLKAVLASVIMDDAGGILQTAEESLARIPHVASVEVLEEGLL